MGTTWGPSGDYGDDVGMTGMTQGPHGVETTETRDHRSWGPHGDLLGAMGIMWG